MCIRSIVFSGYRGLLFWNVFGMAVFTQTKQRLPRQNCLHLSDETLPFGALPLPALLVSILDGAFCVAVAEVLLAHGPWQLLQSHLHDRADRPVLPESP
jgi:hypothetical protein